MAWIARLAALVGVLCLGPVLSARPFTIDDMLNAAALGDIQVDPGGQWLVYAVARPLNQAPRIDYNAMDVIRSRLFVADLRDPGPGRLLDPSDPQSGMIVYGFSPKGTRLAIGRLKGPRWQLGIVTMSTGAIVWTGVTPEYDPYQTTLGWMSEDRIAAITTGDARVPFWLRADRSLFEALGANWRRMETGRLPSVTVVGSGRLIGATPRAMDRWLTLIDAVDGAPEVVATGDFRSLTLSPDRRIAALSEQTTPVNLAADQPLHENDQLRRHRLVLFNFATRVREDVCGDCDIHLSKPVWRPDGGAILFGGRADDRPAASLTAWMFTLASRALTRALPDRLEMTDPISAHGPSEPALGWADGKPILLARPAHRRGARLDWYRVGERAPHCLTCALAAVSARLIQTDHDAPIMVRGGERWRLGANGAVLASIGDGAQDLPASGGNGTRRGLLTWRARRGGIDVTIRRATSRRLRLPRLPGLSLVASGAAGSVVAIRHAPSGKEQLLALRQGQAPVLIAAVNADLDGIDRPDAVLLTHPVSDGTMASSWLLLPPGRRPGAKLPLVVIPYPGRIQGKARPPDMLPGQATDNPWPLVGHGFAVLLPDVPPAREGSRGHYPFTADILAAVDAAIATGHVDPAKLGLYGHSFGGLTAAIVATQTDRFKAIIASAGFYDLVSQRGTFAPWTRLHPGNGQSLAVMGGYVETFQPELGGPPWSDPAPYLAASSVFHADRITTPILIQAGDADAASLQQGEELFSALHRQGKDAMLVSYWGENHVLASPANIRDFHQRMFDWFDCHFDPATRACGVGAESH